MRPRLISVRFTLIPALIPATAPATLDFTCCSASKGRSKLSRTKHTWGKRGVWEYF